MARIIYDEAADAVRGSFDSAAAANQTVAVFCDGTHWATVRAFAGTTPQTFEYTCALAPVEFVTSSFVSARTADGAAIAESRITREPLKSRLGLLAREVFGIDHHPYLALPWLTFDGARIQISGMHLPPEGDPSKLGIAFGPGVSYEFEYGHPSADFRTHYWYWPNADLSGLLLTIDLAASARDSDPFHFRFDYPAPAGPGGGKRTLPFWIPRSFESYRGFPADASQMTRVQRFSNAANVTVGGYNAFRTLEELFNRAGIFAEDEPTVLDWGCGHGRVTCHFLDGWPRAAIHGTDVDAENVAWCEGHLPKGRFAVTPLWPPAPFADAEFDAVFGISVMTHLTADAQAAWFAELARILKPGGIALLTFHGEGNAAYSSFFRDPEWWAHFRESSFDDEQIDPALVGKTADDRYYRNTVQTTRDFVERSSRDFDLLWIERAIFGGYQDCAGLRRR